MEDSAFKNLLKTQQQARIKQTKEILALLNKKEGIKINFEDVKNMVAEGGSIVYATCTVTYAENNGVVKRFLESEEGSAFALAPIAGKACFASLLTQNSPDAHFAAKFTRKS